MWSRMFNSKFEKAVGKAKVLESDPLLPSLQDLIGFTEELVFSFKPLLECVNLTQLGFVAHVQ